MTGFDMADKESKPSIKLREELKGALTSDTTRT